MATTSVIEERQVSSGKNRNAFYRPELDTLRFFAFLAVFAFHRLSYTSDYFVQRHVPLWAAKFIVALLGAGSYGVDLFFVLSSYLITELLLREKESEGSLNVRAFYFRRILRIWPLYYLFITLVAVIPFLNDHKGFPLPQFLLFALLMGNWSVAAFGWPAGVTGPLWSISVEEQFYLFWPPLVAKLSRKQIAIAATAMILIANSSRVAAFFLHATQESLWVNTLAHLDSIAGGILLAVILGGRAPRMGIVNRICLIVLGIFCLAIRLYFSSSLLSLNQAIFGYSVDAAACTAIMYAFVGLPLRSTWLEYLGKISYGLYAYHMMCIVITNRLFYGVREYRFVYILLLATSLGLTVAVAAISYAVLERPFLKLKSKYTYIRSRVA